MPRFSIITFIALLGSTVACKRPVVPAAVYFDKPTAAPGLLTDFTSHFPVPLEMSSDGKLLLRTVAPDESWFGLEVRKKSQRLQIHLADPILRAEFSPDGRYVSFFTSLPRQRKRQLYLWNLDSSAPESVSTPDTFAQPRVRWAPDGKALAFSNYPAGLIVHDLGLGHSFLASPKLIDAFAWSRDSRRIHFLTGENPRRLDTYDLRTSRIAPLLSTKSEKILDIDSARIGDPLVITQDSNHRLTLGELRQGRSSVAPLYVSISSISAPVFVTPKLVAFKSGPALMLTRNNNVAAVIAGLPPGTNDVRGVMDGSIAFVNRSAHPPAIYTLDLQGSKTPSLVYASRSARLPQVNPVVAQFRSLDGTPIPLFVWTPPGGQINAAIVRVHGGLHGMEEPVWQESIQAMLKHGIAVIAVNQRGSSGFGEAFFTSTGTERDRALDVLAGCDFARKVLHVPARRTVVLGHSSGSALAAEALAIDPERAGAAFLAGFERVDPTIASQIHSTNQLDLFVFRSEESLSSAEQLVKRLQETFGDHIVRRARFFNLDDEHNLVRERSWAAIYSLILKYLK